MKKFLISFVCTVSFLVVTSFFVLDLKINGQVPFPGGGSGVGSSVIIAAPYITVGATKYVMATGFPFTAFFSGSFLDANTATLTAGANGSELVTFSGSTVNAWYSIAATTSVEAEFLSTNTNNLQTNSGVVGIWICDSTNSKVYSLELASSPSGTNLQYFVTLNSWTLASCAGTPSAPATLGNFSLLTHGIAHLKLSKPAGSLVSQISNDGGQTYAQLDSRAIGTISKGGIDVRNGSVMTEAATFLSVAVN